MNKIFYIFLIKIAFLYLINCHPKGDSLRKLTHLSQEGLIYFTPASYQEYIMKHPRPYELIMLYTLKSNCIMCDRLTTEFKLVSESYYESKAYKPDISNKKRAVFFGILHYSEDSKSIIRKLRLPSQTVIMQTSPHNIVVNELNEAFIKYDEDNTISYKDKRDQISAHKIIEFVNAKVGRTVYLKKSFFTFLTYFTIFIIVLYGGFFIYSKYKFILTSPLLWLIGSLIIFIVCIGGIVYNIIHGAPFAKFDKHGNIVEYIHSGQRSQYAGEGIIVSSLFVLIGTLLFLTTCISKIPGYLRHKFIFIGITIFVAFLCKIVSSIYRIKASWYSPEFTPPYNYIKGPLIKDQGIAF